MLPTNASISARERFASCRPSPIAARGPAGARRRPAPWRLMRAGSLAVFVAAVLLAGDAHGAGLGFVYVSPNVGLASGGHAALVADGTVYHLQNSADGLLLLVREGWSSFHTVYAGLE